MPPDANWPALPQHGNFTKADHAAHTTPKGTPTWEQHVPGTKSLKMTKMAMKFVSRPHLKMTKAKPAGRKKKK